jgi:hypothetical protein
MATCPGGNKNKLSRLALTLSGFQLVAGNTNIICLFLETNLTACKTLKEKDNENFL